VLLFLLALALGGHQGLVELALLPGFDVVVVHALPHQLCVQHVLLVDEYGVLLSRLHLVFHVLTVVQLEVRTEDDSRQNFRDLLHSHLRDVLLKYLVGDAVDSLFFFLVLDFLFKFSQVDQNELELIEITYFASFGGLEADVHNFAQKFDVVCIVENAPEEAVVLPEPLVFVFEELLHLDVFELLVELGPEFLEVVEHVDHLFVHVQAREQFSQLLVHNHFLLVVQNHVFDLGAVVLDGLDDFF